MLETRERTTTPNLRTIGRVHLALGVIGIAVASALLYPKTQRLIGGDLEVLGLGFIANLALVFGSLMFIRNWQAFRAESQDPGAERLQ